MNISRYRKFVVAVVGALIGWAGAVVLSPAAHISASEWLMLATGLATALGVFSVTNQG